jgi:hypothetical protein
MILAGSVRRSAVICRQSTSCHRPNLVAASMLTRNSSSGAADSAPDHFCTREIRDSSLWTDGVIPAILSVSLANSACDWANSARNLSSVILTI